MCKYKTIRGIIRSGLRAQTSTYITLWGQRAQIMACSNDIVIEFVIDFIRKWVWYLQNNVNL